MALQFYMTVEGEKQGNIEGNNTNVGHEKEILCHALDQVIKIPFNELNGQPGGKRIHGPISITKSFDKSSPLLYQSIANGEQLSKVVLSFPRIVEQGLEEIYFTITLTKATIVKIRPTMQIVFDDNLRRYDHMEEISITYAQIEWRWEPDGIVSMDKAIV
jgi:type VI secretion system secreted protein Hcp